MNEESTRPNPDALLASMQRNEDKARRGRLKIFFGMCPGVGKTFAMLQDALARQASGMEVLVGLAETHGRSETNALLERLTIVPRIRVEYRGASLEEMDLDGILLWHPKLVLVDELAHTNTPGSRHPKRYQDVLELLDAGIDVYSTVNVQHIESRRDTIAQITGVTIRETVPDSVLDAADDIILIDLTPEQLRSRLAEGKVYQGDRAATASENFFRESNLMALREMALRIVAEHVDRDLRNTMQQQRIEGPWKTGDRLLVAIGSSPFSEKLIRYTRRLAGTMEANWIAVHVDTPAQLAEPEQTRLTKNLILARQLGAEVVSVSGTEVGEAILRVARQNNITQIVLGKPLGWRWLQRKSPSEWLLRHSGEIDLHMVRSDEGSAEKGLSRLLPRSTAPARDYFLALGIIATVTSFCLALLPLMGYWAVALLYLLTVVLSATRLPRGPIFLLGASSALLWNFLFIPPRFTFSISRAEDWIMFGLYFVVAIVVSHLTTRLRDRERAERKAEARATSLYRLTRMLATSASLTQALQGVVELLREMLGATAAVLLRDSSGIVVHAASTLQISPKEEGVANWCFQRKRPAGRFTDTLPDAEALHLPLLAGEYCEGVLACRPLANFTPEQRDLVDAIAAQLASFVQKDRALATLREAQVNAQSQRLQKALFDSVSHELKTPLTALSGLLEQPKVDSLEIRQAVRRLTRTVDHLLDATRIESGLLRPHMEWCAPEDLAQESIVLAGVPKSHVRVTSSPDLPAIRVDAGLVAQSISMLLTNAATHSPPDTPIELHLTYDRGAVIFSLMDRGPGIPPGEEEKIFEKFFRGSSAKPGGVGLGLAIARQLAELHGGTLHAQSRPSGGALFVLKLPALERMTLPPEGAVS